MPFLPPLSLPEGIFLLITDALAAPADFVLHRCLSSHLKENKKPKAAILSISESISRWRSVASKSNVNLQHHLDSGSLEFIDVLAVAQFPPPDGSGAGGYNGNEGGAVLKGILEHLRAYLEKGSEGVEKGEEKESGRKLVILDDISMLEWIGFSVLDLSRFLRALRAVCAKANATLLVRHHIVTPNEPDEVFRHLLQICTYHLDVLPLSSGRSGSVSGEVALHSGFSAPRDTVRPIPRSAALQYRLTDIGADFFAKGTSEGVL